MRLDGLERYMSRYAEMGWRGARDISHAIRVRDVREIHRRHNAGCMFARFVLGCIVIEKGFLDGRSGEYLAGERLLREAAESGGIKEGLDIIREMRKRVPAAWCVQPRYTSRRKHPL